MKNEKQSRDDINGRLHSLDQNIRSVEKRLRAVERRLSVDVPLEDTIPEYSIDLEQTIENTREEIFIINSEIEGLKEINSGYADIEERLKAVDSKFSEMDLRITELTDENLKLRMQVEQKEETSEIPDIEPLKVEFKSEIAQLRLRVEKAENHNRINIGSVKIPVELSGIVGALILALTGILITGGRWDIIRSANFSFAVALIFVAAVGMKFYMVNNRSV